MVQRSKSIEVLYKRYNPLVRSVSSVALQDYEKKVYKRPNYKRFRSRKPPKNPRDLIISEPNPKTVLHSHYKKSKYNKQEVPKYRKNVTAFPIFVTKSQFALQRKGSNKSLVVNPSRVKIIPGNKRRRVHKKKKGAEFTPVRRKYKMIASSKKPPRYKMSKSSVDRIRSVTKYEESKSDDGYVGDTKNLNENEWEAYKNNEFRNSATHKKNPDVYGNILGPTPDEAILAGLQTVIEMCSTVDRKPVKKSSIQEVNKQKIMDWVESEYILLNEEIETSTSDISIENLSERKETLQEIEVLVRKKYELENKGAKLKTENEDLWKSNSRQLSVYYANQPSTISDLNPESLEISSEMLNSIRVSQSIRTNILEPSKSSNIFEVVSNPAVTKKDQTVQTVSLCDKTTQIMELIEVMEPSLSESIKSITIDCSKGSENSIESSETSSLSLVEIKSSVKSVVAERSCEESFKCSHVTRSTQFNPDLPSTCTKSTQVSKTNCDMEKCESSSVSSDPDLPSSSSCSSERSSERFPNTRPQIVNYFKVYTKNKVISTTSTSNLTVATMEQPKKAIEKSSKGVMVKCTPIQLDITSSTPYVPLKSASTSTTELQKHSVSKTTIFVPIQSTKSGQTFDSKPSLHVENFTPITIESMLPIIPEIDFSEKSIQTFTCDETFETKSSQTIPPPILCTQSIQIPPKSPSAIDLLSKHAQTRKLCFPCMRSTQTLVESVNTSMEAHSSTLMVQKSVQTKITFDQPHKSTSDTNSTFATTTIEETTSDTSLEEESSSCCVSSKPTVDTCNYQGGRDVISVTTQCDSIPQSNAATDPFTMKIASCQTCLSHWKCISNEYPSTSNAACYAQKVPAYRSIQMCNANTCPMLQEAMVNIRGEQSTRRQLVQTDKRCCSSSRIQVCNPTNCPMLKSASVNICEDMDYQRYKLKEETEVNKRRIKMCSSRNCRMLKEAMVNITNLDSKEEKSDSCKIPKLQSVKKKRSILKCGAKSRPILQQAIVNICSIENNPDLFESVPSKCSCYKSELDEAYITCKDVPVKACATRDDCFCYDIEENIEEEEKEDVESQQFDDFEDEVYDQDETVIIANENIIDVKEKDEDVKLEESKVKIFELNDVESTEIRQHERIVPQESSHRAVAVNKDKGNSKSSTQRIRQSGQSLKRAIHIRLPSPSHKLPSGVVWEKKK